jgi:hypothetical protein
MYYFKRLQFIDFLIRRKATGSLQVFADKNRLSKNGLLLVLREMKEMGFPIKYSRALKTYYYEKNGQMVKTLFMEDIQILTRDDMRNFGTRQVNNICFSETAIFELC